MSNTGLDWVAGNVEVTSKQPHYEDISEISNIQFRDFFSHETLNIGSRSLITGQLAVCMTR